MEITGLAIRALLFGMAATSDRKKDESSRTADRRTILEISKCFESGATYRLSVLLHEVAYARQN